MFICRCSAWRKFGSRASSSGKIPVLPEFKQWAGTGLGGFSLCMFGGAILGSGVKPLTIVVSFDGGEKAVPGGIPGWGTSLVHESGF